MLPPEYEAGSLIPTPTSDGCIRIREFDMNGEPFGCEMLWRTLIFECYNLRSGPKFYRVYRKVLEGKLNKEQYVSQNTQIEFQTIKNTAAFYQKIWLPHANRSGLITHPIYWFMNVPDSYEDWIKVYSDRTGYPWNAYGTYYDTEIVPYLKKLSVRQSTHKARFRSNRLTSAQARAANTVSKH